MTAKTLKQNGKHAHQTTSWGLTEDEVKDPDEANKARKLFDEEIEKRLGPSAKPENFSDNIELAKPDLHKDEAQQESFAPDKDDLPDDAYDNHMGAELTLQKGDQVTTACVKRRKLNNFGDAIGNTNPNPILDAQLCMLEFQDGAEAECSANVIAENMWAQRNIDGNQHQLMEAIVDHKPDEHMQFNAPMAAS
jgi:hypothetical protein